MKGLLPIFGLLLAFFAAVVFIGYAFKQTTGGIGNSLFNKPKTSGFDQLLTTPTATPTLTPTPTPTPVVYLPPTLPNERVLKVPILLYHYISTNPNKDDKTRNGLSTPPDVFDKQLALLAQNGFVPITFDELAAAFTGGFSLPPKPVILTFDDGYADFYTNAYPILRKYNMKGVAFIATGLIGGGYYMTWSQVEEVGRSGFVFIEAHSVHHFALAKVSPQVLLSEVEESKKILEQHVGYKINWFAYPYGSFNETVVSAVKQAGFIGSATTLPGAWQYQSRFFYMPRYRAGTRLGGDLLKLVS